MDSRTKPVDDRQYGQLSVRIFDSARALGVQAAKDLTAIIRKSISERGLASVILATGNSQLMFMEELSRQPGIEWDKVSVFHMDEYLGMAEDHPASFRRYIREHLVNIVHPRAFYGICGDAADAEEEMRRYTDLLKQCPPDAVVMGIGENGHLAFNDPPADFGTDKTIQIVNLDEACRRQQFGEGWFPTLDQVPKQALSLTVPALISPKRLLVVVPEERKAKAVRAALEGPITPDCPASILQQQAHAVLYLDRDSASLLA